MKSRATQEKRGIDSMEEGQITTENNCRDVMELNDFDFNTMHNLIYFSYTGEANLGGMPRKLGSVVTK
jgi:hypothetical protein